MTGAAPQGVAQTSPHTPTAREERAVAFPAAQALRTERMPKQSTVPLTERPMDMMPLMDTGHPTVPLMDTVHPMTAWQLRWRPSTSEYGFCADSE